MSPDASVEALLSARRLERVPPDPVAALGRLRRAEDKLAVARQIAELDVDVAYVTAYDAARIAITAHMLAHGYRARAATGAHEATGSYAEVMIASPRVREFQRMRRRRNKAEYDDAIIGHAELLADLDHAGAIVEAVRADLGTG